MVGANKYVSELPVIFLTMALVMCMRLFADYVIMGGNGISFVYSFVSTVSIEPTDL